MWKDTEKERLERYKNILKGSPLMYKAAIETSLWAQNAWAAQKNTGTSGANEAVLPPGAARNTVIFALAPALCSYVLWVIDEALKAGKKRLYFLARDACFMYEAALIFCREFGIDLDCRYLCCSRYSVRIPMYHLNIPEALDYICLGGIDVTAQKILLRSGISQRQQDEVFVLLKKEGLKYERDEVIPYSALSEVKKLLGNCPVFLEYLSQNSQNSFPAFESYLEQEGLFDGVSAALVDSGWVGSMQKNLNSACRYIYNTRKEGRGEFQDLEGYYWGLYELVQGVDPEKYHCYYFSPAYNMRRKVYFSNCLFEAVFSAPHGMTAGYRKEEEKTEPVFAQISSAQKEYMYGCRSIYRSFAAGLAGEIKKNDADAGSLQRLCAINGTSDKKTAASLLGCFMGEPSRPEAKAFGSLHFSDDVTDHVRQILAAPLSEKDLRANHALPKVLSMAKVKKTPAAESAWYEASAVRKGINVKRHLSGYRAYKRLLYIRKRCLWRKIYGKTG